MHACLALCPAALMRARSDADDGYVTHGFRFRSMPALARCLTLATAVLSALALGLGAASAGAVVVEPEVGGAKVGAQPRNEAGFGEPTSEPKNFANPTGAAVLPSSHVYAIYWDPTDHYHGDWQHVIDTFLQNMGTESGSFAVFSVDAQYTDSANQRAAYRSTFMGALTDTTKYPVSGCEDPHPLEVGDQIELENKPTPICLTDQQIRTQLELFMSQHSLPRGMGSIYYLLTPPGVTVCLDAGGPTGHCSDYSGTTLGTSYEQSFCSYHSDISPGNPATGEAKTILYATIPWIAGGAGDYHLHLGDQRRHAFECQDGGFNPASEPPEEKEKAKEKTKKQEEEFEAKTGAEKAKQLNEEELEGPHIQEPNQLPGVGPDGSYDEGLADLIINQIAVEQQNTVTDPLLNAWQDPAGNEVTDECRNLFDSTAIGGSATANLNTRAGSLYNQTLASAFYYLNDAFNLAAVKLSYPGVACVPGTRLIPQFTAPDPVKVNELVGFDGMESDITLNAGTTFNAKGKEEPTYATYTWNFGDGTPAVTGYAPGQAPGNPPAVLCEAPWLPPCAGSTFHSYQYGGTYEVTLTVTDVGGNTATTSQKMTVVGPPPPAPPTPPAVLAAAPIVAPVPVIPGPSATAAAVSSSLKQVARNGLVVHYSVNEQVAGRFEVLLDAATAHRLGISGPVATNMAAGSPKLLVIGHALLVTTKGGRNSVRIKFSKSTAKHLRQAHKVTLTLRLVVRNASSQSPLFTTVLSNVVLHR
jgi:hypothetical protein